MANLQAILAYQEIDRKMFALEKEISESAERKAYVRLKKYLEGASEKLDALEAKASGLKTEAVELTKKYLAAEETLKDFENLDELVAGGADIDFYKKQANIVLDKMKKIKADLTSLEKRIKETDEEYKSLKAEVKSKQKDYKEAQEKFAAYKASKEEQKQAIEKELSALANGADAEILAKYKVKRKEKIFPVIGQLYSGRCPFCSMEPPIVAKGALKGGGTIDCDNCHRILYGE
jgi:predicted  nucleic acid-binding Zn-ribbon protein